MQTLDERQLDAVLDDSRSEEGADGVDASGAPADAPPPTDRPPRGGLAQAMRDPATLLGLLLIAAGIIATFTRLHPSQILSRTTATGGDMGSHVYTPDFVRRELLPNLRLWGWSNDWYAGFPVLGFYFPAPSWAIALLSFLIPYQVAFKLITVSGILSLPVAGYYFGKWSGLAKPLPILMAFATFPFLYERQFWIYGGNILSTMAGEFSFSISMTFALLFLGGLARVVLTGRGRALTAVFLCLTALCHLLPTIFAAVSGLLLVLLLQKWPDRHRVVALQVNAVLLMAGGVALLAFLWLGSLALVAVAGLTILAADFYAVKLMRQGIRLQTLDACLVATGGIALGACWLLPFERNLAYSNDMGWEKITRYTDNLFLFSSKPVDETRGAVIATVALFLAAVATVWILGSLIRCILRKESPSTTERIGVWLVIVASSCALLFRFMPQFRLWNARVLPFWFFTLYLLAAFGLMAVGLGCSAAVRWLSRGQRRFAHAHVLGVALCGLLTWLAIGTSTSMVPDGVPIPKYDKGLVGVQLAGSTADRSNVGGWADWNYRGYEKKHPAWDEYRNLMNALKALPPGRAMWDYEGSLDRFGTPMALMLIPYWTKSRIASMEGLYFESSATTPYHFMNAALVSNGPSNPQRDLPYGTFDMTKGVKKLQEFGVRYYITFSPKGRAAAAAHPDLRLATTSTPLNRACQDSEKQSFADQCNNLRWEVYEIAKSEVVSPLAFEPAVVKGVGASQTKGWLDMGVTVYNSPETFPVPLVSSGPKEWQRIEVKREPRPRGVRTWGVGTIIPQAQSRPLPAVQVSDIKSGTDWIDFKVDKPGVPVLVKISYFPNWKVKGGKGPYRVSPNFMVVIPTKNEVKLRFGRTSYDYLGYLLSLGAIAGLFGLRRNEKHGALLGPVFSPEPGDEPSDADAGTELAPDEDMFRNPPLDDDRPPWWTEADDDTDSGAPGPAGFAPEGDAQTDKPPD